MKTITKDILTGLALVLALQSVSTLKSADEGKWLDESPWEKEALIGYWKEEDWYWSEENQRFEASNIECRGREDCIDSFEQLQQLPFENEDWLYEDKIIIVLLSGWNGLFYENRYECSNCRDSICWCSGEKFREIIQRIGQLLQEGACFESNIERNLIPINRRADGMILINLHDYGCHVLKYNSEDTNDGQLRDMLKSLPLQICRDREELLGAAKNKWCPPDNVRRYWREEVLSWYWSTDFEKLRYTNWRQTNCAQIDSFEQLQQIIIESGDDLWWEPVHILLVSGWNADSSYYENQHHVTFKELSKDLRKILRLIWQRLQRQAFFEGNVEWNFKPVYRRAHGMIMIHFKGVHVIRYVSTPKKPVDKQLGEMIPRRSNPVIADSSNT